MGETAVSFSRSRVSPSSPVGASGECLMSSLLRLEALIIFSRRSLPPWERRRARAVQCSSSRVCAGTAGFIMLSSALTHTHTPVTLRSDDFAARRALWLLPFGRGLLLWEGVLCCSSELLGLSQRVAPRAVQRWAVVSLLARVPVAREADVLPAWTHTHTQTHTAAVTSARGAPLC